MDKDESQWRTRAVEDFLRTVYTLQQTNNLVQTMAISRILHIKAPSVTDMIRRLGFRQQASAHRSSGYPPVPLLEHTPYQGVRLTPTGTQIAVQIIRRRRLLMLYLVQMFGFHWDEVDAEADRLEHDLSEQLTQRLALALGYPQVDPCGNPIPNARGEFPAYPNDMSLTEMQVGQRGVITRVIDYSPDLLHYLGELGLHPGAAVRLIDRSAMGQTVAVQVGITGSTHVFSVQVASHLRLTQDIGKQAP